MVAWTAAKRQVADVNGVVANNLETSIDSSNKDNDPSPRLILPFYCIFLFSLTILSQIPRLQLDHHMYSTS